MRHKFNWTFIQPDGWILATQIGKYLVYVFTGDWKSGKYKGRIWASFCQGSEQTHMICNVRGYKSLDHAKQACERHYKHRVKAIVAEAQIIGVLTRGE